DEVLSPGGLRTAAAAVPAGGPDARVRADAGRRGDRVAGRRPAGADRGAVRLGAFLRVQQGPGRRLGFGLVHVRALQRAGAWYAAARRAEQADGGVLRRRLRRDRRARAGRAAPPAAAAAVLPGAGRVPDDEQGLVAAVRRLAGAAGRARPPPA